MVTRRRRQRRSNGLFGSAEGRRKPGHNIIILSDRNVDAEHVAIPALLATGRPSHLIREGLRTEVGLVVETGEARRVHDFCLLAGYGAEAMNPYLAFDTLSNIVYERKNGLDEETAHKNFIKAVGKGMMKVMSKMGISTYQSYCGAQIFDAVGLRDFIEAYFTGTAAKVEGAGLREIAEETEHRHALAFGDAPLYRGDLDVGGDLASVCAARSMSGRRRRLARCSMRCEAPTTTLRPIRRR